MVEALSIFFSRLSKREKYVLYGTAFFISLVFLDRLVLGPILSKMKSLNKEIQSQQTMAKKSLHILAQKDKIAKEVDRYDSYIMHQESQEEEIVFLLKEIEKMANKHSVYVIDIKSAGFGKEGVLKKYIVKLNCEAQMEQLTGFFYEVESSKKLLKIERFDIRPKTQGSSVLRCAASISKAVLP